MLGLVKRMHIGIAASILTPLGCYLYVSRQGLLYGEYDWPVLTIDVLILEVLLLALVVEGMRPRNPYRYADPLMHYKDVDRSLNPWKADVSLLWHTVPILLTLLVFLTVAVLSR